jgi:aminoglycoside 3-N-acetyltransferase
MMISEKRITEQLLDLGVAPGGVLLVHCSFSHLRPVENGPLGLIAALRVVLGPHGTLVMPSMTDDDEHPFDPLSTPCAGMGILADTFWRLPGVLRSDSPHAFAAQGPLAVRITAPHPVEVPHGLDSPVGRVYELDGQVLLLGVDHTADTTIHLAEYTSGVRYRRKKYIFLMQDGKLVRLDYAEIDHCCQNFNLVNGWLDEQGLQRKGQVGQALARLARARDILAVVTERLKKNETTFLHPFGVDEQCDEARMSIL